MSCLKSTPYYVQLYSRLVDYPNITTRVALESKYSSYLTVLHGSLELGCFKTAQASVDGATQNVIGFQAKSNVMIYFCFQPGPYAASQYPITYNFRIYIDDVRMYTLGWSYEATTRYHTSSIKREIRLRKGQTIKVTNVNDPFFTYPGTADLSYGCWILPI